MKIRYRRRISLGKHIKLNISKSGISTSIKIGRTTINPQRNKITYNTPIKGLSIESKIVDDKNTDIPVDSRATEIFFLVGMVISIILAFCGIS
jgi:hypothetical protein